MLLHTLARMPLGPHKHFLRTPLLVELKIARLPRKKLVRQAKIGEEVDTSSLCVMHLLIYPVTGAEPPRTSRDDRESCSYWHIWGFLNVAFHLSV